MTLAVPTPHAASAPKLKWGVRAGNALMFALVMAAAAALVIFVGAASALSVR